MLHHYIAKYSFKKANGTIENRVESWIQINVFKWCFCFSKKRIKLDASWEDIDELGEEIDFSQFKEMIIETNEKNPKTIAIVTARTVELEEGYRVKVKPKNKD